MRIGDTGGMLLVDGDLAAHGTRWRERGIQLQKRQRF